MRAQADFSAFRDNNRNEKQKVQKTKIMENRKGYIAQGVEHACMGLPFIQ